MSMDSSKWVFYGESQDRSLTLNAMLMAHAEVLSKLESVSMDMWDANIGGVQESIPLLARSSLRIAHL